MSERKIDPRCEPVLDGRANRVAREWVVYIDGKRLADSRGRVRRFKDEISARTAGAVLR